MMSRMVDLPQPEAPRHPRNSPLPSARVTSFRIWVLPRTC